MKEEVCPECDNEGCKAPSFDCPTYYDGCHCCDKCAGFSQCDHAKWSNESCEDCAEEYERMRKNELLQTVCVEQTF